MSALTSLLARDQVVPVRKIEEALQKQVVSGGEMSSVLLELDALPENTLAAYCAALYRLLPATRDEVMRVPRDTIRIVPREIAERHRMIPLAVDGGTLLVAMARPLDAAVEEQLGFLLGFELVTRIVCDVRISAALLHHYAVDAPPRHTRLIDRLRQREPGPVPYVAPPDESKVHRTSLSEMPAKGTSVADWLDDEDDEEQPPSPRSAPTPARVVEPRATDPLGIPREAVERAIREARAPARPSSLPPPQPVGTSSGSEPPRSDPANETASALRRLRGPLTTAHALKLLEDAKQRDEILEVFFAFARQFFDYAALFVVHDDVADGRDAFGAGATVEAVRRIAVPLEVPGTFGEVRRTLAPRIGRLDRSELDRIVLQDLQRPTRVISLVLPVAIRGRAVLLFYADRAGDAFDIPEIPELLGFVPRVVDAFERLILRRKRGTGFQPVPADDATRDTLKAASRAMQLASSSNARASWLAADTEPGVPPSIIAAPTAPPAPSPEPLTGPSVPPTETAQPESPPAASARPPATPPPEPEQRPARSNSGTIDAATASPALRTTSSPAIDVAALAREGPRGAALRSVLGIPRAAPPPPNANVALPPVSEPPPPAARDDDEPELTLAYSVASDPGSGEHELDNEEPTDPGDLDGHANAARGGGTYRVRDAAIDVVGPRRSAASAVPSERPRAVSAQPDPRAEPPADLAPVSQEVIHVPALEARRARPASAPNHPRAAPPPSSEDSPSVIVDMGDQVNAMVVDLSRAGPDQEQTIVDSLLRMGEAALPTLAQAFPGPLWFDRRRPYRRAPPGRDVSAIARALAAFRDRAVPYVATLIDASQPDRRFYATLLAGELVHPGLVATLADRAFDDDEGVRAAALELLPRFRVFAPEWSETLAQLRRAAKIRGRDPEKRRRAARALGALRDAGSVRLLIELLDDEDNDLAEVAHRSLVAIACDDMGAAARRWMPWLQKNERRHRIEWLIDALSHSDEALRAAASEELKALTQQYYGFHPAASRKEREVAQQKYRRWWEAEGIRLFGN